MTRKSDDPIMWDDKERNITHIQEFAYRTASQPRLQVEIPKRGVKGERLSFFLLPQLLKLFSSFIV